MQLFLTPVFGAGGRVLGGAISRSNPTKKIATKKAQNSQNVSDFFWIFCAFLWPFPASPGTLVSVGLAPGLGLSGCGKPLPRTYRSSRGRNWRRNAYRNRPLAGPL